MPKNEDAILVKFDAMMNGTDEPTIPEQKCIEGVLMQTADYYNDTFSRDPNSHAPDLIDEVLTVRFGEDYDILDIVSLYNSFDEHWEIFNILNNGILKACIENLGLLFDLNCGLLKFADLYDCYTVFVTNGYKTLLNSFLIRNPTVASNDTGLFDKLGEYYSSEDFEIDNYLKDAYDGTDDEAVNNIANHYDACHITYDQVIFREYVLNLVKSVGFTGGMEIDDGERQ